MVIGIIPNAEKEGCLQYTRKVIDWLLFRNMKPIMETFYASEIERPACGVDTENSLFEKSEFLIILGGDGTMLRASHNAAIFNKPMLGINLGTLGYLTDVDRHEGFQAIDKVLKNDYKKEKRMMLEINSELPQSYRMALNDVCISRGASAKLITIVVMVNGLHMDTLRADGIILSTPTGSTAYNLSAGGPILKPDSEMIVITAVCPHALYTRPWVIDADDIVEVRLVGTHDEKAVISIDGDMGFHLRNQETISI